MSPASGPASGDLGYLNARVRAMRGALIKAPEYEALLRLQSAAAVAERLKSTRYAVYLDAAALLHKDPRTAVLSALAEALSASLARVWDMAPEGARAPLRAVFSVWEAHDLKTIIRALARGVRREEIRAALIPAGELDAGALSTLLASKDMADLVAFLDTWGSRYATVLRAGLKEYQRSGRIIEMELALDLHTHRLLKDAFEGAGADSAVMRGWLGARADLQNALTLYKTAGEGYAAEAVGALFLEGGAVSRRDFLSLAAIKGKDGLMAALRESGAAHVRRAVEAAGGDPMLLEEAAEDQVKEGLRALAIVDPLSIALPASYVYMLVREIKNLRLISRGADFGIPYEVMKALVFYPV